MSKSAAPLPENFLTRMEALLGCEYPAFIDSYTLPVRSGLRVNQLRAGIEDLRAVLPWQAESIPWCPAGLTISPEHRPGKHPFHTAGLYYLQEPSAMAVAEVLDVRPGHLVLDVSAAPGGKATHLASLLLGEGVLVANDPIPGRIKALGENLERWGARNAVITNSPVAGLAAAWPGVFDRVLADAPCSGEGMFRKSSVARQEWSEEHVQGCAVRQDLLLNEAATMVKPGGLLLYSTCTFAPEENEQQICRFLARRPEWEIVDIPKSAGLCPGRVDWAENSCDADVGRMARIWPHLAPGEGHAMALLRAPATRHTVSDGKERTTASAPGRNTPAEVVVALWDRFKAETLPRFDPQGALIQRGEQLFLLPEGTPPLNGVRVVRPGLPLGRMRPGRFEPSHALALAAPADTATHGVALSDEDVVRYLHGETVTAPGPPGWVFITTHQFGLGWGKRSGDVVKNHYPKGLRW
ncbi:RsmF rRNA methyltransferase first C-terminal domain-containing protein [soil metagenome]